MLELSWLPEDAAWDERLEELSGVDPTEHFERLIRLANSRINFVQTGKLDRVAQRLAADGIPAATKLTRIKLALLGTSTVRHLIPGIRVAGLRRGFWVEVFEGDYGQYYQDLNNVESALHRFSPTVVCFAFDARTLYALGSGDVETTLAHVQSVWGIAKTAFACTIIHQTALPIFPELLGSNEHRLPRSPHSFIAKLNARYKVAADNYGVDLLSVDSHASNDGIRVWHDETLWHKSKQEIHPRASHTYGEYVMRVVGAQRGRSRKCLVLDLDNTLWGGVIGDDGLAGIKLGRGSAIGEAYLGFQQYVLSLRDRGVILAVCSKNEELTAFLPFTEHPEMLLKRSDIACFVANWTDKATNLKAIAKALNIGLDSLVFVDDNQFERNLVRELLPDVAVPELPEDPAMYALALSDAGYFESVSVTQEDLDRTDQYKANAERENLREKTSDLAGYIRGLQMELSYQPFDEVNLIRIEQLINKTNQFNLTTKRYSRAELVVLMEDSKSLTWQIRLRDRFGDNGIIAAIVGQLTTTKELVIVNWLMSCRVIGRQVEDACINLVIEGARRAGAVRVVGEYRPTANNGMVRDLFQQFRFRRCSLDPDGNTKWVLEIADFKPRELPISIIKVVRHE
jgi:FkbH-like protein